MEIEVSGTYHDIASFVSGVASLPRIVTLHNMSIKAVNTKEDRSGSENLKMTVSAKTYRYNGDPSDSDLAEKKGRK